MLEKLESLEEKYEELNHKLSDPEIIGDPNAYTKLAKAHAELEDRHRIPELQGYPQGPEEARAMLRKTRIKSL